jgi:NAD(P)-dependent dehydrogenase (short-subunit alcohol dehydrogenase family)
MVMELFNLTGRIAIVTGGSQRLGRGTALALAEAGADVVVVAREPEPVTFGNPRRHDPVGPVVQEVEKMGRKALGVTADLREKSQVDDMLRQVLDRFGRVDILVNNAGASWGETFRRAGMLQATGNDVREAFRLNFDSTLYCCQAVAPVMQRQGKGVIVNVATVAIYRPAKSEAMYAAAKAAMAHLSASLAAEVAPAVRVNVIAPGAIESPDAEIGSAASSRTDVVNASPMGRLGRQDEYCAGVLFLASDASGYTTGSVLNVTGGQGW